MINFPVINAEPFGGFPLQEDRALSESDLPAIGERTRPQHHRTELLFRHLEAISSGRYCMGGSDDNPCGWYGWEYPYLGTYDTYRFMLQHPRIQQARATVVDPIIASSWDFVGDKATAQQLDWVKDTFNALRPDFIRTVVRGIDYGHQPYEPIWGMVNGMMSIVRMKDLLPDLTQHVVDPKGNWIGLQQGNDDERLRFPKAWVFVHQREGSNWYGRSQLENIRAYAWADWLRCLSELERLGVNVSGIIPIIIAPEGEYTSTADGTTRSFRQDAVDAARYLATGRGIVLVSPKPHAEKDQVLEAADVSAWSAALRSTVDTVDLGNRAPAIAGLMERMRHDEDLMFAGYHISSRTGMQSEYGSRADSSEHKQTGLVTSEVLDESIAGQLQPLIDMMMVNAYGIRAKGLVSIKPSALVDRKVRAATAMLDRIFSVPELATAYVSAIDGKELLSTLDIPILRGVNIGKLLDKILKAKSAEERAREMMGNATEDEDTPPEETP